MKKKLYLHIGMGKTGTTALQDFFAHNRQALGALGIVYPERGVMSNAHHLLSPHIPRFLENEWQFEQVDDWAPDLAETGDGSILLSSELMAWADEAVARKFCAQVSAWFDLHVVVYVRRQDNIIMASYNQQIKAGPQRRRIDLIYQKQMERFDYPRILAPWADSLEPGKVIVRPYERQQFHGGDIRRDFMYHVFGVETGEELTLPQGNSNPRLSLAAGEYKRMVNCLVEDGEKNARFNELLMQYSAARDASSTSVFSNQSVLSPEQRLEVIESCRKGNKLVARLFLGREDGSLFLEPEPAVDDDWEGIDLSIKDAASITDYLKREDPVLVKHLGHKIDTYKDAMAFQKRHSARFLAHSVLGSQSTAPVYRVAREDAAPIVIGGLGGSGTRLVVSLFNDMGVEFGGELNESLDNLWFSLLFVRRTILLRSDEELDKLAWLFTNAMRQGLEIPEDLQPILDRACEYDRSPVLPPDLLIRARESILAVPGGKPRHEHWGWKQPNTHILLPLLDRCFPEMKYVYVVRNGLDMAFSENQNQLKYFWGDLLLEGDISPSPLNALRYWVAAHKRMQGFRQRMGHRLHFLSFDRLCVDPEGELEALREFAGIQVSKQRVAELAAEITLPATSGRFRQHDLSAFDPLDVEFVRQMGFEVE